MARLGGAGVIPGTVSIEDQVEQVKKVSPRKIKARSVDSEGSPSSELRYRRWTRRGARR